MTGTWTGTRKWMKDEVGRGEGIASARDAQKTTRGCCWCKGSTQRDRRSGEGGGLQGEDKEEALAMTMVSFPKVVVPSLLGSFVLSWAFWDLSRNRKVFGGTVAPSFQSDEWEKETQKRLNAWPREAAGPVVMNPISRQNYHKT